MSTTLDTPSLVERFAAKYVEGEPDECWLWTGSKYRNGYGSFHVRGSLTGAHRVAYELARGAIPPGLEIDHLCRVRACVNPRHLEAVTHRENMHRTPLSVFAVQSAKTHCKWGHEFTPENIYVRPSRPNTRTCITCWNAGKRKYKASQRAARDGGTG